MKLVIYGTNGSAKEIYDLAKMINRWSEIMFLNDYIPAGEFRECKCMSYEEFKVRYSTEEVEICIAIGEPTAKKVLYEKIKGDGFCLATLVCPDAIISPSAVIGEGVIIKYHVIISAEAVIEDNVYIQSNVIVGHNVVVKKHCQLSSYVHISGNTVIEEGVYIGVHCPIRERINIGRNSILSMGAVVLKDVPEEVVVMGNPARVIAKNESKKVFK